MLLVRLQIQTPSIDEVRAFLDQVARSAPDDDRGWLGQATLAIHDGSYDKAARLLEACLRRRPADIPVWRARLDWALATHRLRDVRRSLEHLPVSEANPAQIQRLIASLAACCGDQVAERQALERLIAVDPTDFAAFDRLVAIAGKEGRADLAAQLRRHKTEIQRWQARYEKLNKRNQTIRDARELASLAGRLGRRFEAKVFGTIAIATEPDHPELRDQLVPPGQDLPATQRPVGNLAELLAEELEAADRATTL
jgi:thioredoxin-like negative regulator of GroEL